MGASADVLMGSSVNGNKYEIHIQECVSWETTCWGCGLRVVLPRFAPMFRCGWCGAITVEESDIKPISPLRRRCSKGQHRFFVSVILLLIISIVAGGIWATFPVLFPTATMGFYVHSAITTILSFNTLFNFCRAAFTLAGPSPPTQHGKYDLVGRQSLEGYKFCVYCERPKPPNSHYCRSCNSCVVEMDHHCPFIGNCVGSNNLQYFLLFLVFATVSGFYLFGMTLFAGFKEWPNLMTRFRRASVPRLHMAISLNLMADMLVSVILNFEPVASIRALVLFYLFISFMGLAIGVGLLLYHQVKLVCTGQTYIDSLSPGSGEHEQDITRWTNLRQATPMSLASSKNQFKMFCTFPKSSLKINGLTSSP